MNRKDTEAETMTDAEREELDRMDECLGRVDANLRQIGTRLGEYQRDIQAAHDHMWEARRDMDHIDKVAMRQSIDQMMRSADVLRAQQQKLEKLRKSPYFGRFDFARAADGAARPFYIGVHDFRDEETGEAHVTDWRAPVASLFYDYETGAAEYRAPSGAIRGDITLKRQFRIRDSAMEMMLETGVNIVDDVLQDELSRASDEGMRNIVATIQRDQNAIIRDAEADTLIIQGVAGSGKTSIALHRIAFLLYRFKDTLTSSDILIISPNRVFADYIGNVLPELGEETVPEIGMETLARQLLGDRWRFETFFEQTTRLLETDDPELRERIAFKAHPDFLRRLDAYADHLEETSFVAADVTVRRRPVPAFVFERDWKRLGYLPPNERVSETVKSVVEEIEREYRIELRKEERQAIRKAVDGMVNRTTLRKAYAAFYDWLGRPELFHTVGGRLEYADVFPLIHLRMKVEGVENPYGGVKHLLVDEMQDYTPVQYAVLGKLFSCRKTILGDATQSVNPYSASSVEASRKALRSSSVVRLDKSYRSTWEIMQFALAIAPNPDLVAMKRHGEAPQVLVCDTVAAADRALLAEVGRFEASDHRSLAIIAKTGKEAKRVHGRLAKAGVAARLLDETSVDFRVGIVVLTPHLAKGLEFDRVVVADGSAAAYATEMDRNLLYVACTRAMHALTVIAAGEASRFLPRPAVA